MSLQGQKKVKQWCWNYLWLTSPYIIKNDSMPHNVTDIKLNKSVTSKKFGDIWLFNNCISFPYYQNQHTDCERTVSPNG